jgi:hypothetical protein
MTANFQVVFHWLILSENFYTHMGVEPLSSCEFPAECPFTAETMVSPLPCEQTHQWISSICSVVESRTFIQCAVVRLFGCEAWTITLRDERRLRMFKNRVLRRIFGPKMEEVTGEWRRVHNEELHDLLSSPNITGGEQIKKNKMGGACGTYGCMGDRRGACRVLVLRPGEREHL